MHVIFVVGRNELDFPCDSGFQLDDHAVILRYFVHLRHSARGDKPEKAYFVRCDRSTMNQNDIDNGRLVCLIGVAAIKPAEFVIFRIGQWTADQKV